MMNCPQEHKKPTRTQRPLVRIVFELPENDWHGYGSESMWAEDLDGGRHRLRNTPFAVYGFSFDDVVHAERFDEQLVVTGPVLRSGRSTFRIFLEEGIALGDPHFEKAWQPLCELGGSLESATPRLVAIDVPPGVEIRRVQELVDLGMSSGLWDWEEGHRGAPLVK